MTKRILAYTSDDDRSYGAAGMAIALYSIDRLQLLHALHMDAEPYNLAELHESLFFAGNPSMSAQAAMEQIISSYATLSYMALGNMMCRTMVYRKRNINADEREALYKVIVESGAADTSLEEEECENSFYNILHRLTPVFNHPRVHDAAHTLSRRLREQRTLSRLDITDLLHGL